MGAQLSAVKSCTWLGVLILVTTRSRADCEIELDDCTSSDSCDNDCEECVIYCGSDKCCKDDTFVCPAGQNIVWEANFDGDKEFEKMILDCKEAASLEIITIEDGSKTFDKSTIYAPVNGAFTLIVECEKFWDGNGGSRLDADNSTIVTIEINRDGEIFKRGEISAKYADRLVIRANGDIIAKMAKSDDLKIYCPIPMDRYREPPTCDLDFHNIEIEDEHNVLIYANHGIPESLSLICDDDNDKSCQNTEIHCDGATAEPEFDEDEEEWDIFGSGTGDKCDRPTPEPTAVTSVPTNMPTNMPTNVPTTSPSKDQAGETPSPQISGSPTMSPFTPTKSPTVDGYTYPPSGLTDMPSMHPTESPTIDDDGPSIPNPGPGNGDGDDDSDDDTTGQAATSGGSDSDNTLLVLAIVLPTLFCMLALIVGTAFYYRKSKDDAAKDEQMENLKRRVSMLARQNDRAGTGENPGIVVAHDGPGFVDPVTAGMAPGTGTEEPGGTEGCVWETEGDQDGGGGGGGGGEGGAIAYAAPPVSIESGIVDTRGGGHYIPSEPMDIFDSVNEKVNLKVIYNDPNQPLNRNGARQIVAKYREVPVGMVDFMTDPAIAHLEGLTMGELRMLLTVCPPQVYIDISGQELKKKKNKNQSMRGLGSDTEDDYKSERIGAMLDDIGSARSSVVSVTSVVAAPEHGHRKLTPSGSPGMLPRPPARSISNEGGLLRLSSASAAADHLGTPRESDEKEASEVKAAVAKVQKFVQNEKDERFGQMLGDRSMGAGMLEEDIIDDMGRESADEDEDDDDRVVAGILTDGQ